MTDCVLFDFFGTLVNYTHGRTTQSFVRSHRLVSEYGLAMDYEEMVTAIDAVFRDLEAKSREALEEFAMQDAMATFLERQGHPADTALCERLSATYVGEWAEAVEFLHGLAPFLRRLSRNYRLGIITNTHYPPMIDDLLTRMEVRDFFELVVTSVEHGRPKPHPDIFKDTLDRLGIGAEDAVYVGDSFDADYRGATNVGMPCYLIGNHARVPMGRQIASVFELPLDP